jgi:SAM-dependent methyltransferase
MLCMNRNIELPDADYTVRDQRRMEVASRYFQWQYDLARRAIGNRVLEVGCGVGNVTSVLQDRELIVGVDVEPECVKERARRFSGRANIISRCLDVLDPAFPALAGYGFDSVVCLNVLEHIRDDAKALEHMGSVLQPGGSVILIIPAFEWLYGPIDRNLGHFRRYSKRRIAELARSLGFELAVAHYINFVGLFGWWVNARILRRTEQSEDQIRLFDSCIVPVLSRAERLVHPPCGQSIFAVLRKQ